MGHAGHLKSDRQILLVKVIGRNDAGKNRAEKQQTDDDESDNGRFVLDKPPEGILRLAVALYSRSLSHSLCLLCRTLFVFLSRTVLGLDSGINECV